MNIRLAASAAVAALLVAVPASVFAQGFTITDVTGREVTFDAPVERAVLGEGRMIYTIAPLSPEAPFDKVVGWRNDLYTTDLDSYNAYAELFPKMLDIPFLGNLTDGTLQTETVVTLDPDVFLLPIETQTAATESGLIDMLESIDVKVVFIDFRAHVMQNTEPSLRILGKLFGEEERAEEIIEFWSAEIARVTEVLEREQPERPLVFMYRAAGLADCCGTFGNDNYGLMVELAGGTNLGSDFLPGYTGTINPEQVIASDPEIVVVTGSNWTEFPNAEGFVNVGPNAAGRAADSRVALAALMEQPAFTGIRAVEDGRVHAIWHQFYTSPYQFAPIQQMAKWFHPELFGDIDPEATFRAFHERFLPVPYQPGYWLSLNPAS